MRPLLLLLLSGCATFQPVCPHGHNIKDECHVVADNGERADVPAPAGGGHVEPPEEPDGPDGPPDTDDPPADDDGGHGKPDRVGNPGNDKEVGKSGERPNGRDGWGSGDRGRGR